MGNIFPCDMLVPIKFVAIGQASEAFTCLKKYNLTNLYFERNLASTSSPISMILMAYSSSMCIVMWLFAN